MLNIKSAHPLYSVILVFCVAHAFAKLGVTSSSVASVSLGQDVGLGLGRYLDPSPNGDLGLGLITVTKRGAKSGGLSEALESTRSPSPSEDTLRTAGLGRGVTSELSDLFAVGSSNASIPLNSKVKLVELEGGSSAKTDQIKANVPGAFNLSLNGSKTDPMPKASESLSPQQANVNKSLIVPSEGGVLEEGLSQISPSKSSLMAVSSTTTVKTEVKETKEDVGIGQPPREGVSSLVKPVKSEDAHISARKDVNLFEQTESENSKIYSTMGPLTYTSSEISLNLDSLGQRTQKISPRKGAELPKIFPRKGVDEQFVNSNSSDQFLSDITSNKNNTGSIVSVSVSSPTASPTHSSEPADNPNPMGVVKHINTSKTLQNSSMTFMTEKSIPPSVSPNSENTITGASNSPSTDTMEAVTSKTEPIINGSSTKSNSTSSTSDVKNSTLDKSGIVASYPPLKKRPKPLKTTDVNTVSRPPITTEHNPGERDYVIPIVVTILTVPMLVVLVLFLYKKGSEFWERRHYRRMDFLIDGMYND